MTTGLISLYASGTQTATVTTEHFLSSPNVNGAFKLVVDLVNLAANDVVELRLYQMVLTGGTQRVVPPVFSFAGVQSTDALIFESPLLYNDLTDTNALRFSLTQTKGTGRNFPWKVLQVDTVPTNFSLFSIDGSGRIDLIKIAGTTQTARDIGASVLLSAGTGTGQLDFTSGVVKGNAVQILGTAVSTPATAGVLDVNVKNMNNVAATSITTINANQGTTQPVNFTGTGASALVKDDVVDIAGAAVSTSTAQIGVNAVNWAGGAIPSPAVTGVPKTDLTYILGTLLTETAGQIAAGFKKLFNVATPTAQADNLPLNTDYTSARATKLDNLDAAITTRMATYTQPTGFLAATFPATVASTTNITSASGITVATNNDKTGYGLSSAAVQAIWDALTSALTTVGSIGKLLVDNINATISSRMATYTQPTGFLAATFPATVASTTNITAGTITTVTNLTNAPTAGDLTTAMKASVNAEVVDVMTVDVVADSVVADGSRPTIAQGILMLLRFLFERSVSGTTVTVKKEDGSTTSMTFTINDGTNPTSITRAS